MSSHNDGVTHFVHPFSVMKYAFAINSADCVFSWQGCPIDKKGQFGNTVFLTHIILIQGGILKKILEYFQGQRKLLFRRKCCDDQIEKINIIK